MRHERVTGEIQETAALYALGALSQHEADAFEAHLREDCPTCQAELLSFENVVASLVFASREMEPPPYLRDLVAARAERESPSLKILPRRPPDVLDIELKRPAVQPPTTPISRPVTAQPPPKRSYWSWIIAAVFAIAALAALYFWKQAKDASDQEVRRAEAAFSEAEQLRTQLETEKGLTAELAHLNGAIASRGLRTILLQGQQSAPDSSMVIFWETPKNRWVATGQLPPAPMGKNYQLWFVTQTGKISAGVLKTDSAGHSFTIIEVPSNLTNLLSVEITLEPEGGSIQPTSAVYAAGKVS